MSTVRRLEYRGPGRLTWREAPAPELGGCGDAIVRPLAVASCDLDQAIVRGLVPFEPPFVLGHECVAEVIRVAPDVSFLEPGDRVAVSFQISCGTCDFCARSLAANCTSVPRESMYGIGVADWGGVLAEEFRVPFAAQMLVKLPAELEASIAASASDNVADAWRAVAPQLASRPGAPVLVLNGGPAGSIGLLAAHVALSLGATPVDYWDRNESRLALAESLGATVHELAEWPRRLGPYAIVVDAGNERESLGCALRSTEPGGECTSTSMYLEKELPVPIMEMYSKGVSYRTGRVQSRALLPVVLDAIAAGRIDPSCVVTETASFDEAPEALLDYTTKLVLTAG